MTRYRRNLLPGATYFFTVNLAERRPRLLTDHINLPRAAFRSVRERHPFTLDAVVVLPDHLHAVWTLPEGDADFALRRRLIKTMFSRGLRSGKRISPSRMRKASVVSGSDAIGSTRYVTRAISRATSIMCASILSNTVTSRR